MPNIFLSMITLLPTPEFQRSREAYSSRITHRVGVVAAAPASIRHTHITIWQLAWHPMLARCASCIANILSISIASTDVESLSLQASARACLPLIASSLVGLRK
jgi:hypothetical protein